MKKLLALLLALSVVVCCAACASDREDKEKTETEAAIQTDSATESGEDATEPSEDTTEPTELEVTTPTKKVNTVKLKSIEMQDDFAVKVESVNFKEDYYDPMDGLSMDGYDVAIITTNNNSGKKITGFSILVLAIDEDGQDRQFAGLGAYQGNFGSYSDYVELMVAEDIAVANQESHIGAIRCDMGRFEKLHIIVYSYTDDAGNEVINENAYEWLENTLPV